MSLNQTKSLDPESIEIRKDLEKRQTKWFYDDSDSISDVNDVLDDKTKENRVKSASFRHVTHISWKDDGSLEISTNDRGMADFFRKVGDTLCLQEGKDVKEVIFDYVANSMNSQDDFDENKLENDQKGEELNEESVETNRNDGVIDENEDNVCVNERLQDKTVESVKVINIGKPYNFKHVTHCTFDRTSGFNVVTSDRKLSWFYTRKEKKKECEK